MAATKDSRVAIVTGGGRGIGREHALTLAERGLAVVVNDLGGDPTGSGADVTPASTVVEEIRSRGGQAVVNGGDVADFAHAEELIQTALTEFGRLDVVVNNAGILRDRTLAAMSEAEWDAVIRVHLKGTFAVSHFAAAHWRARYKATGKPQNARLINTTSASGIYGNFGQSNYGAAKAGIASLTIIAAKELEGYGVTVNAVAPVARTRLTPTLRDGVDEGTFSPVHIARVVAWLAGSSSAAITGRVFDVWGARIGVSEGWRIGPTASKDGIWTVDELDEVLPNLVAKAAPNSTISGVPETDQVAQ